MASASWTPAQAPSPLGRYRILSPKCGLRVSPLQLGAMSLGDANAATMGAMTKDEVFELLDAFVAAGGNTIDTASSYQDEQSEKWIGEWMKARGNRDQLVIATKYTNEYRAHALGKNVTVNHQGNHKRSMFLSVRDSLTKLQTDWIDILYLHWWDNTTSIEEIMDGLDILVKQGKVLYLGISDAPAWIAAAGNTYAAAHGKTPFVIYQGAWNVLVRDAERDILPMAQHFGMAVAAFGVLGGGRLKSKQEIAERTAAGGKIRDPIVKLVGEDEEEAVRDALARVAAEHGEGVTVAQVAIAYVMSKAPYVFPVVGGRKVAHLQDNIKALELRLTAEQVQMLEGARKFDLGFPHNALVQAQWSMKLTAEMEMVKRPKAIGYD